MLDWAASAHVGFSLFVSVGGMIDIDFADLIDFLGEDPYTRSILIYMDTIGNARRFMSAARSFARNKPIIVLKPGPLRRERASGAAALHGARGRRRGLRGRLQASGRLAGARGHRPVPCGRGARLPPPADRSRGRDRHQRRGARSDGRRLARRAGRAHRRAVRGDDGAPGCGAARPLEPPQSGRRSWEMRRASGSSRR